MSSISDLFITSFCDRFSDAGIYVTVTAYRCAPKDLAKSIAYSAALNECSEPSIATRIFEILLFVKLNEVYFDKTMFIHIALRIKRLILFTCSFKYKYI